MFTVILSFGMITTENAYVTGGVDNGKSHTVQV